jgi:hypothetical protein
VEGNDTSLPSHRLLSSMESGRWITSKSGGNVIMDCGRDIFLCEKIIQHLHVMGRCTLNLMDKLDNISMWSQGWREAINLGLEGNLAQRWDHFLA